MSETPQPDLSGVSMLELFRSEAETQCGLLTSGLLELERGAVPDEVLAGLMRAAIRSKGRLGLSTCRTRCRWRMHWKTAWWRRKGTNSGSGAQKSMAC